MFRSVRHRSFVAGIAVYSLLVAQVHRSAGGEPGWRATVSTYANDAWVVTKDKASGAWRYSKAKAHSAYKVAVTEATPYVETAKEKIVEAAEVSWVWAKEEASDAWDWVKEQTPAAKAWVADNSESLWLMTREKTGELYLWVKLQADESGATSYVRTTLDEAWTWTTDTAGRTWLWIKGHKVEMAVAAIIIGTVVAAYFMRGSAPSERCLADHFSTAAKEFPNAVSRDQFNELAFHAMNSRANANNYRHVFTESLGKPLPLGYQVHHAYPQKYEAVMRSAGTNIHNPFYLQGVDPATHARITRDWSTWDRDLGHVPSADDVKQFKAVIDGKYAGKLIELEK